jgi:hypothetical protein
VSPTFTVELTYVVSDHGDSAGRLHQALRITNTSAAPLSMAVFSYADFDLNASSSGDSATAGGCAQLIRSSDGSTFAEYEAWGAIHYFVAPFATVRGALADLDIDNFSDTGLPFPAGDATAGYQWNQTVASGATSIFEIELRINSADPSGACCLNADTCVFMTRACCREMGGVYQGDAVECVPGLCSPAATGACCTSRCACTIMTRAACETAGGAYRGDSTTCEADGCALRPGCPCNWNGDAFLNSQDMFDFLSDLFDVRADYNCDTFVNSQDFFDFLACFLGDPTMCP